MKITTMRSSQFKYPHFTQLNLSTIQPYQHLTYPLWHNRLQQTDSWDSLVAIGVELVDRPIGLAIASLLPQTNEAQILSLFVKQQYRQQGIGGKLLQSLTEKLPTLGCRQLKLDYLTQSKSTFALERLLSRQGWNTSLAKMLICHSTTTKIKQAPWLHSYHLPAAFQIFPLAELTRQEYQAIVKEQTCSPWYPEILSPFKGELPIDPFNSLGLRYQGKVVGWMATHRLDPNTIRYTSLFVRKDLQKMGRAIPLLAEAIKRQVDSDIINGIWTVATDNKAMVEFVKRRLQPFLTQLRESRQAHKLLLKKAISSKP